jgi:uncharacterized protein YjbJ (UPF0337 family)
MADTSSDLKWQGRYDQIVGKAKELWGDLTDDDFDRAEGNAQKLLGIIEEKTGESLADIEEKLEE